MKRKVLLQFDHDQQASSFDSIVAIDSGVDQLLTYGGVGAFDIESLIHGAMFTRGPKDLHRTAAFFGGSDVEQTMQLFDRARKCFFGPFKISMMADPNGANTTAVAAVLSAEQHISVAGKKVTILAGTGPVGQRIAQLMAQQGATVQIGSRRQVRAQTTCDEIASLVDGADMVPVEINNGRQAIEKCQDSSVVFGAGAAGVELLHESWIDDCPEIRVLIDVNAVPPAGLGGLEVNDHATKRGQAICYGAIGVGGIKMKIHRRSIESLFESNESILDLAAIYKIGHDIVSV